MADVSVVYNLIINAPDAQETFEDLTGSARELQDALQGLGGEGGGNPGEPFEEGLPPLEDFNAGLGSLTKNGRTSSRVLSGLATAVQHVSPEAAQAMRALSGMSRAMTAAGTAATALGAVIAPLAIAIGALLLVYRQLAAAVEEAEARMTAAAEQAERAAAAHQQFKAGLVDVQTQIQLINGEIDQYELTRLEGVKRLEEAAKEQLQIDQDAVKAAQDRVAAAEQELAATEQRNAATLATARERLAAEEALTAPMQAALDAVAGQSAALQNANIVLAGKQDILEETNVRLEEGRQAIAQYAEYGRESAEQAERERKAREEATEAARQAAEAKRQEAEAARAVADAEAQQAALKDKEAADVAAAVALEVELGDFRASFDSTVLEPLSAYQQRLAELAEAQAELAAIFERGVLSSEEYAARLEEIAAARARASEAEAAALQQAGFDNAFNAFAPLLGGDLLGSLGNAASGILAPVLGPAAPIVSIGLQIAGLLEGLGAAGLALEAQLEQARERGDEDTVREIEAAIERYGSASGAALADRIGSQIDNLAAGIGAAPSVILNALPEILLQARGDIQRAILLLPLQFAQALLRNLLDPGRFIRIIYQGMIETWQTIKAELKEFVSIFSSGQERRQDRRAAVGGFFAGLVDGDGRPFQSSGASSARSTSSSSASAARQTAEEVARLFAILDGRAGTFNTAAGGGLRRQFARLQQGGGEREGGGVQVTVNAVAVDPGTLPRLSQQVARAGTGARFGKSFGG